MEIQALQDLHALFLKYLRDWQIIDIDLLSSRQEGDYIKLGIEKGALKLIDQSPSLILISAETESGSVATLESYHNSSNISRYIISGIGMSGVIVCSLALTVIYKHKKF